MTHVRSHRLATAAALTAIMAAGVGCGRSTTAATTESAPRAPAAAAFTVAGYLVPWDPRSRVGAGQGVLAEVNPVWFQPTETGAVGYASPSARSSAPAITADAAARGVRVAPSISNFRDNRWDGALIARLIVDPAGRAHHIAAITGLVRAGHWPGIDIDYESLPASSRSAFSAFVTELAAALHRLPAKLSVTVHAKTAEPGDWSGAQAQDWRAIGAAADQVRVMAYDYSQASTGPGPIAPTSWVARVLRLATRLVPLDRIALGVPTYGYDWRSGADGVPLQWAGVNALTRTRGVSPKWDPASSEPWLRYRDTSGREHTVWYDDARSLGAELDLARRAGVTKIVLWYVGGEDPAIWPILRATR